MALAFSERGKARRLLRDVGEILLGLDGGSRDDRLHVERIRDIRSRLRQSRPLTLEERAMLWTEEEALLSHRSGRAGLDIELASVLAAQLGVPDAASEAMADADEPIIELPGGGVIACGRCYVFNRIASTYCSACGEIQPKTSRIDLDVFFGGGTERDRRFLFGDHLYNQAVVLFHDNQPAQAEEFLRQAMEHGTHPDWSFFLGMCRMTMFIDADGAVAAFEDIVRQQFDSGKYPFWPLPVSPGVLGGAVTTLRSTPPPCEHVFEDLMRAYAEHSANQKKANDAWQFRRSQIPG